MLAVPPASAKVWLVGEVIMLEIVGSGGLRRKQPETGFQLLTLEDRG